MPKKHQHGLNKPAGGYVHPSLGSSKDVSQRSQAAPSSKSVNDRLAQLRREQTQTHGVGRRDDLSDALTQRTVPPALRSILSIPEVAPPMPKPGIRLPGARRGPPGPATPRSWLTASRHAPQNVRASVKERCSAQYQGRWRPHDHNPIWEAGKTLPSRRTLVHQCLKTLATHWDELLEYEHYYLPSIPIHLKSYLLSYISAYGPFDGITLETLETLFPLAAEDDGILESAELTTLDLSDLLNPKFTLAELNKFMRPTGPPKPALKGMDESSRSSDAAASTEKGKEVAPVSVADSWEDEADADSYIIPSTLSLSRFPNLTHLSLANPAQSIASWPVLLNLSSRLPTLTHLSLAYWPPPSATPKSKSASMISQYVRPISFGGTDMYNALDDDWHEAANILRRFSNNTYCLRWLDLTGCTSWIQALIWGCPMPATFLRPDSSPLAQSPSEPEQGQQDNWSPGRRSERSRTPPGPDWNGSWRQLSYVNVSQGWIPVDEDAVQRLPAGILSCELLGYLRERREAALENGEMDLYLRSLSSNGLESSFRSDADVRLWLEREKEARAVARRVKDVRVAGKVEVCQFDHGWSAPVFTVSVRGKKTGAA